MNVIFPPRPKSLIPPGQLDRCEKQGRWLAQRKFGGHRNLLHVSKAGRPSLFSRYGRAHPSNLYSLSSSLRDQLSSLKLTPGQEYWIDGELLHPRVPETLVLFDVLQAGKYLFGMGQIDRLALLKEICGDPSGFADPPIARSVTPNVWMAETFDRDLKARFAESANWGLLVEGLLLRERDSYLDHWGDREYEVDWQVRVRKPSKSSVI